MHFFADIGVNAIVCHHTHCAGGYEIYNGVPIFYSLGNFIFDKKKSDPSSWFEGYFIKLNITHNSFSLFPYFQNKNKAGLRLMQDDEKNNYFNKITELNKIICNETLLNENWRNFCRSKEYSYLISVYPLGKWKRLLFRNKIFKSKIIKTRMIKSLYSKINCEAHKEALLEILKNQL